MKVALVHEFLNQLGGAERVLENFGEIWPDSTLHVLIYDELRTKEVFKNYKKKTSFIDKLPFIQRHYKLFLPLMPKAIESFEFQDYDVVLADSSAFAKGVLTEKLLICYCHTPTRYLWTDPNYLNDQPYPWLLKFLGKPVLAWLRHWDYNAALRVNYLIANSENIRNKIKKYYDRDSVVIPPPVDTGFFHPVGQKQNYFFTASRLEPYKRMDLVIQAFNELKLPLKVAGSGTEEARLKKIAGPNIEFLGWLTDDDLRKHYAASQAFVFAAEEDAGIAILEAQACGTPVIAYGKGGALETIKKGITGEFFPEQTADSLKKVLKEFRADKYDLNQVRGHALAYDKKEFQRKISEFVAEKFEEFKRERVDAYAHRG